jgi:hypothetical protein
MLLLKQDGKAILIQLPYREAGAKAFFRYIKITSFADNTGQNRIFYNPEGLDLCTIRAFFFCARLLRE